MMTINHFVHVDEMVQIKGGNYSGACHPREGGDPVFIGIRMDSSASGGRE